jgi:site-specific DNA recombinase
MSHKRGTKHNGLSDPGKSLRAAIYARISTGEQAAQGRSIETQLRIGRAHIARQGWTAVRTYSDPGYAGSDDRRPGFRRMIADALAGEIEVIVLPRLDRFSRSIADILHYSNELREAGVLLASANEPFDLTDPAGQAQFATLPVLAQR